MHEGEETEGYFHNMHTNNASDGKEFVGIPWNACGMEECAENDVVDIFEADRFYWDAVLIQYGALDRGD